jgi:uncharacterized membrane protein
MLSYVSLGFYIIALLLSLIEFIMSKKMWENSMAYKITSIMEIVSLFLALITLIVWVITIR